jgi:two-component system, OmpR family, phosphate regulon sensor histidine kinase PhoR
MLGCRRDDPRRGVQGEGGVRPQERAVWTKTFPWRIFSRLILIQSLLVLGAMGASGLTARYFYKHRFLNQIEEKVKDSLTLLVRFLPNPVPAQWCQENSQETSLRFSVINVSGHVVCDSQDNGATESFLARPEVKEALRNGFGGAMRAKTKGNDLFYGAILDRSRGVLISAAMPLTDFHVTMGVFDASLGALLALFALLLGSFAVWSGQKLVFPIGRLIVKTQSLLSQTPDAISREEIGSDSFGEWSELETNIDNIRRDLEAKARTLDIERVELATIMGAISDAILAVDPEGTPLFFNSRFQLLFGSSELRERNVKLWEIFRDPEILGAFNAALHDGKAGGTKTIPLEQADGIKRYFSLSVSPLRRLEGTIYGAVGIFHDISELKSAEQMRIDFVANVSHELRTPLTSIKGYAETLIQDLEQNKPASKDFLSIIARNSNRLMNLMEDLLDLSSIESDHILQKESLSTEEVTTRILKQLEPRFTAKNQRAGAVIEEAKVTADPGRLEQVLVNLLDNASKYTPEGGEITVRWTREKHDVLLRVIDTGPGIPVEHQSRLFERFYRVDKARSREQGGTGLGLAIVKHIMQRHEGTAWIESRAGQGSTFICRFPG